MIFVTVGTTLSFDVLIEAVDNFAAAGSIPGPVVCQIGNGAYIPKNCEHFRFQASIDDWIKKASLVVCHGGTGTVLALLSMKKNFIAVANKLGADDHQAQFLARLNKNIPILWTGEVGELPGLVQKAASFRPDEIKAERVSDDIRRYINSL